MGKTRPEAVDYQLASQAMNRPLSNDLPVYLRMLQHCDDLALFQRWESLFGFTGSLYYSCENNQLIYFFRPMPCTPLPWMIGGTGMPAKYFEQFTEFFLFDFYVTYGVGDESRPRHDKRRVIWINLL